MLKIQINLGYKQKLTLVLVCIAVIPIILFSMFYMNTDMENRKSEILSNYSSHMDKCVQDVMDMIRTNQQKFDTLDKNSQLQLYLSSSTEKDMLALLDMYYHLNTIYQALCLGSVGSEIKIYSKNMNNGSLSYILPFNEVNTETSNMLLKRNSSEMLWIYEGTSSEREQGLGNMHFYKLNRDIDGKPLAIEEIKMSFITIKRMFEMIDMPKNSFIVYDMPGGQQIIIRNEGLDTDSIYEAVNEYNKSNGGSKTYYSVERKVRNVTGEIGNPQEDNSIDKIPGTEEQFIPATEGFKPDRVILFLPKSYVFGKSMGFLVPAIAAGFGVMILIMVMVNIISKILTKRLYTLISEINTDVDKLLEKDQLILMPGDDEFSQINLKFYELVERIHEYYKQIVDYHAEKRILEVELLQDLINPHLLYNTLGGIKWFVKDSRVSKIVDTMVRYYRIALNKGNKILRVSQELDMLEEYLKLQKFAYESDFKYVFLVEDNIKECLMLKHLLQPIVENAVVHGINKQGDEGSITILGKKEGNCMVFEVRDNGEGITEDKIQNILDGTYSGLGQSYGLYNVQKRIELQYGEGYGLKITSEAGEGTVVAMVIPGDLHLSSFQE